jgi:hypothetical protein
LVAAATAVFSSVPVGGAAGRGSKGKKRLVLLATSEFSKYFRSSVDPIVCLVKIWLDYCSFRAIYGQKSVGTNQGRLDEEEARLLPTTCRETPTIAFASAFWNLAAT